MNLSRGSRMIAVGSERDSGGVGLSKMGISKPVTKT